MMIDMGLCLASNLNPQVVHNGVLPLLCSAALFIRAGICPVQCPDTCVSVKPSLCLSLGAEPSRSRSPWVKLIRFPPSLPQTGALSTPGVRSSQGQQKRPLTTAPGSCSHAVTGTGACVSGLDMLTATTTGQNVSGARGVCQDHTSNPTTNPPANAQNSITQRSG
jgi:hypothetical protein